MQLLQARNGKERRTTRARGRRNMERNEWSTPKYITERTAKTLSESTRRMYQNLAKERNHRTQSSREGSPSTLREKRIKYRPPIPEAYQDYRMGPVHGCNAGKRSWTVEVLAVHVSSLCSCTCTLNFVSFYRTECGLANHQQSNSAIRSSLATLTSCGVVQSLTRAKW